MVDGLEEHIDHHVHVGRALAAATADFARGVNRFNPRGEQQLVLELLGVPGEVCVSLGSGDTAIFAGLAHQLLRMQLTTEVLADPDADVVEIYK